MLFDLEDIHDLVQDIYDEKDHAIDILIPKYRHKLDSLIYTLSSYTRPMNAEFEIYLHPETFVDLKHYVLGPSYAKMFVTPPPDTRSDTRYSYSLFNINIHPSLNCPKSQMILTTKRNKLRY